MEPQQHYLYGVPLYPRHVYTIYPAKPATIKSATIELHDVSQVQGATFIRYYNLDNNDDKLYNINVKNVVKIQIERSNDPKDFDFYC